MLKISDLKVSVDGKEILRGVDLEVGRGQIHVIMGPNGSGKSTLVQVIAGHPSYVVNRGSLMVNGEKINKLMADKRAKQVSGIKYPVSSIRNTKYKIQNTKSIANFRQELLEYNASLKLSDDFLRRSLNEGFSGGEKKRSEILQMLALKPKLVILDEIDSGLDVDGLKLVASAIKKFAIDNSQSSIVLITHYARILKYLKPDFVHVMVEGKIVKSGKMDLAKEIEEKGYQSIRNVIASEAKQSIVSS